jgi:drug/metabolite transporter (DMT)-like permease
MLGVALALASSVVWGSADFLGGLQSRLRGVFAVLLWSQLTAAVLGAVLVLVVRDPAPHLAAVAWAGGGGALGITALGAFYRGLAVGTMSIVAPISATGAAVPVLVGVAGGERPAALQVAGIAIALVGIVLAAREPGGTHVERAAARAAVGLALVAAVGFGTFLVGMERATDDSGVAWALLIARIAETSVLLVAIAVVRPHVALGVRALAPLMLVGALDIAANGLFALATTKGLLSIIAVVGSLYPAMTVVLARTVLHERVTRVQEAGVLATLLGVVAISAG